MTRGARIGLLVAALVVLVVAFVLLRPSAEETDPTSDAPPPTATATATATATSGTPGAATPSPTPKPTVDPGPVLTGDEVQDLRVNKGEVVRFQVRPPGDDHVHVHGYDIMRDVKAGETTRIFFRASIDGIFEIELEDAGLPIAELRVDP